MFRAGRVWCDVGPKRTGVEKTSETLDGFAWTPFRSTCIRAGVWYNPPAALIVWLSCVLLADLCVCFDDELVFGKVTGTGCFWSFEFVGLALADALSEMPECGKVVRVKLPRTNLEDVVVSSTSPASDLSRCCTLVVNGVWSRGGGDGPLAAGVRVFRRTMGELYSPLLDVASEDDAEVRRCGERVTERRGADIRSLNALCWLILDSRVVAEVVVDVWSCRTPLRATSSVDGVPINDDELASAAVASLCIVCPSKDLELVRWMMLSMLLANKLASAQTFAVASVAASFFAAVVDAMTSVVRLCE